MSIEPVSGPDAGPLQPSPWPPPECTLPAVDQRLRLAEFDQLFTEAVRSVERTTPTTLAIRLAGTARRPAQELADRESACCPFFTFAFSGDAEEVLVEVTVPLTQVDVLAALAERAQAATEGSK